MKQVPERVWLRDGWRLYNTVNDQAHRTIYQHWRKVKGSTQVTITIATVVDGMPSELWAAHIFKNGQRQDMIRDEDIARLKATCDALFALELI